MAIATLIAKGRLDDRLVGDALDRLREVDPGAAFADWVDQGDAADLFFAGDRHAARAALDPIGAVDIVVQPAGPRLRRLLVADMDSTIIGQECIDELADYAGCKAAVAAITERAMQGELDFAAALRERVRLLAGLDEQIIGRCLAERVTLNPGARTLIATLRAHGASSLLISGGFLSFAEPVGADAGFDRVQANRLLVENGRLTGEVADPIVDSNAKRAALVGARRELGLDAADVLAIGDGANDVAMIQEAGLGVAFKAKPALASAADAELRHHDLDALLWVMGVAKKDWVSG
jgi:phosphoserine phosphatase